MPRLCEAALSITSVAIVACASALAAPSLVIPPPDYRPPETVQRVAVPIVPGDHLRLLIISGESSYEHDWTGVNNLLRAQLLETGRFDVRVIEDFSSATDATLKPYDVVLINYLGRWNYTDEHEKRWGAVAEKALFDYVRNGGGAVVYHASFNMGSPSWPAFERFAGGTMRPFKGSRRSPPAAFMVHVVDRAHPITRGMREYFWTLNDDLYANMYWDQGARVHVLATAFDASASYAPALAGPKYPPALYYARGDEADAGNGRGASPGVDGGVRQGARVLHQPGPRPGHASI